MNSKAVKTIRKVERPRPLRSSSIEYPSELAATKKPLSEVLPELEKLYINICNSDLDEKSPESIAKICDILKTHGPDIDLSMRSILDHYFVTLRNVSREDRLDAISRLRLLEIIELKAMSWQPNDNVTSYYKKKFAELEGNDKSLPALSHSPSMSSHPSFSEPICNGVPLAPGEILRSSGKFMNPTKIAGKNYYKDEVVIRNSDSGKVMGIKGRRVHMIEELSDTIISFQRVNPGARDRRVQIAGPNEESISFAKTLVEDTIRRNASPVRMKTDENSNFVVNTGMNRLPNLNECNTRLNVLSHSCSMVDASREYATNMNIRGQDIKVSTTDLETLRFATSALQSCLDDPEQTLCSVTSSLASHVSKEDYKLIQPLLQRSASCMDMILDRASISPLDTSDDDETFKDEDASLKAEEMSLFTFRISDDAPGVPPPIPPPRFVYSREFLMHCRNSPLCKIEPEFTLEVHNIYPMMIRDSSPPQSTRPSDRECAGNFEDAEKF